MSEPNGHRLMGLTFDEPPFDLVRWNDSAAYRYAVDLFNHGYYWEAHEVWEGLWRTAGRRGTAADFLKGLIKLAAALVKAREGRLEGVRRHARRADELFAEVAARRDDHAGHTRIGGLRPIDLRALAQRLASISADPSLHLPLPEAELSRVRSQLQLAPE